MLNEAIKQARVAILFLILTSILTGLLYPALITGIAQLLLPWKANGSLVAQNGKRVGSLLIGQSFTDLNYFWGRPSATAAFPYNAANSSGSNLGPSNPILLARVKHHINYLKKNNFSPYPIPIDLVTTSGSGLDPEISPAAAFYQVPRIARARGLSPHTVQLLVKNAIKKRFLGILGEPRINVLEINLALDKLSAAENRS
jgi:K+-transporting ATPase ATPase C chain